ncbi:MAG TPA: class I SAM-dependent methyltransferase [Planctomycetaceae bacterium]
MAVYSRWIFPRLCDFLLDRPHVARHRRELLSDVTGDVLEIGFGTGLNLPHYPEHVRKITAVDPNPGMNRLARLRAEQAETEVDVLPLRGEELPFGDGTFDTVVSTFTLCSIDAVDRAVGEVYRVLRPEGRVLFLEHGLSHEPGVRKWQRRLNPLERRLGGGCRLDKDIPAIARRQPFRRVEVREFDLEKIPKTHGHLYRGTAAK